MSHFATLVLVPNSATPIAFKELEPLVSDLLAPYDENIEVEKYDRKCHCIGNAAYTDVQTLLSAEFGNGDERRTKFWERHPELEGKSPFDELVDDAWHKEVYQPVHKRETELLADHPLRDAPDPNCEQCCGTGLYKSEYNPESKWDWWSIGGRWTGLLTDYDPEKDEKNIETCWLCNGTGMRNDDLGKSMRESDPTYTCNGCNGTGKEVKWPTQWKKYEGDVRHVSTLLELDEEKFKDIIPYAVVTPDGVWHERGEMGWWGMSSNDKDKDDWASEVHNLLEQNKECLAVVVDCHI